MWLTSLLDRVLTPTAIALGNFDGVHLGHQKVLRSILNPAKISGAIAEKEKDRNRPYATVVTFNPHPQEFFSGESKQLLTPLPEKIKQLEGLGIDQLMLLPFDRELAALSPQQFVEQILIQKLQAKSISVGQDFRFGHHRAGTAEDLQAIASQFGITVRIAALKTCSEDRLPNTRISSSSIRQALAEGDIARANQMLGRSYSLTGKVIRGQQLGRTLGFPTANLELPPIKLLPRYGVYCARVWLEAETGKDKPCRSIVNAVTNIGCRPTVSGDRPTVEVHLLDWSGNLYDRPMTVRLESFLRPEQKFSSLDALKTQIAADCDRAKEILKVDGL